MVVWLRKKSDELGILSSTLCMIHCMITPFLFVVFPASTGQHGGYEWWSFLDLLFLSVSFLAVFRTVRQSAFRWIKVSMIAALSLLTFFILNERLEGIEFPFDMVYFPAFALAILHLVHLRKCRCATA
nr:MerC domain-containing protein [Fulvivirga aurantia]